MQERLYDAIFLTQVGHADAVGGVAGEAGNGMLVIDYANGDAHPTQTSDDSQALIIASDYDSAWWATKVERIAFPQDIKCAGKIHAAARVALEKWRNRAAAAYFVPEMKYMRGP